MFELTPDEIDLLERVKEKPELRPFFFRRAKGLKWFDALELQGYFSPIHNPRPEPAQEEGYVTVGSWPAIEYLVSASEALDEDPDHRYAKKLLDVVRSVSRHAFDSGFSNYRTWWQLAKIVRNLPPRLIEAKDIEFIDFWLKDPYERSLVADEIGTRWVPRLLESKDSHSRDLARGLIGILFEVEFSESPKRTAAEKEAILRIKAYEARKIAEHVAVEAGKVLGLAVVDMLQIRLQEMLRQLNRDQWSSIWRPSIADHDQNRGHDDAEDIILEIYRDTLLSFTKADPIAALSYVQSLVISPFETIRRVAVLTIDVRFAELGRLVESVLTPSFFTSNLRHEVWCLLKHHYVEFSPALKTHVIDTIRSVARQEQADEQSNGAVAYAMASWLSAIKDSGVDEAGLYAEAVRTIGGEPEHPDFSSYMSVGWVEHKSPISVEQMLSMTVDELSSQLQIFLEKRPVERRNLEEVGVEGLLKAFRQVIKAEPLRFCAELAVFKGKDPAPLYEIAEAVRELWVEKTTLPWDDVWSLLIEEFLDLLGEEGFWVGSSEPTRSPFIAGRGQLVGALGRLIVDGTRSDDHAFNEALLPNAERLVLLLLARQEGDDVKPEDDAVFHAINSPRGKCIEALFNLSLRVCRLAHQRSDTHVEEWARFQPIFEAELRNEGVGGYEFSTLVGNYLPNLLFLSKDWVVANLPGIFPRENYKKWLCAIKGYAYVNVVYEVVYKYLRDEGLIVAALDDVNLKSDVHERLIQNIVVAYFEGYESLNDDASLICQLLKRRKYEELGQLIWFVWTLRDSAYAKLLSKLLLLWKRILQVIDISSKEGRRLASRLSMWAVFVSEVNDETRPLLVATAPFAEEDYNAYQLLESLAKISIGQPKEAGDIWLKLLERSRPDFPEQAVQEILRNLCREGAEGIRAAKRVADEYIKGGNDRVHQLLLQVMRTSD